MLDRLDMRLINYAPFEVPAQLRGVIYFDAFSKCCDLLRDRVIRVENTSDGFGILYCRIRSLGA